MIGLYGNLGVNAIYFTVTLLIYLLFIEFGSERARRVLAPGIVIMVFAFIIIAIRSLFFSR